MSAPQVNNSGLAAIPKIYLRSLIVIPVFLVLSGVTLVAQNIVGNPTGSQTITQPSSTSLTVTGGNGLITQRSNNVRICTSYSGSDIGAQVNACMADLGSGGGEAIIPAGTYNLTTQINPLSNVWLHGQGKYATIINSVLSTSGPAAQETSTLTGTQVSSIACCPSSNGYIYAVPLVVIDPAPTGGTTATATANVTSGSITSFTITNSGVGYTTAPTVNIYPEGAPNSTGHGVQSGGQITGFTGLTLSPNCIYLSVPTVYIEPPNVTPPTIGTQAMATAVVSTTGCSSGYYKISSLSITYGGSNYGSNPQVYIYPSEPVIFANGNASQAINKFSVSDLTITNGVPSAVNYTGWMDGIRFDYCNHCSIERTNIISIQGPDAIAVKDSQYVTVSDNDVTNVTQAGIQLLTGNQYVWVQRNHVNGITCVANGTLHNCTNPYLIASGSEDQPACNPYGEGIWVQFNTVSNNPYWEGLDAHGGSDLWYTDNSVLNTHIGVMMVLAASASSSPILQGIHVERNSIDQGTALSNGYGITINSDTMSNPVLDIWVKDNWIYGYGATSTATDPNSAVIKVYETRDLHIIGNTCIYWSEACIMPYENNLGGEIVGNFAYDLEGSGISGSPPTAMISVPWYGNFGLRVEGNQLLPPGASFAPMYQISNVNEWNNLQIGLNYAKYVGTGGAQYSSFLPMEFQSQPVTGNGSGAAQLVLAYLDPIYDDFGRPQWRSSAVSGVSGVSIRQGYASTDSATVVVTGTINSGSTSMTLGAGGSGGCPATAAWVPYFCIPEGANIAVYGAGTSTCPNGVATNCLYARVVKNDTNSVTLDKSASSMSTGGNVVYQLASTMPDQTVLDGSQRFRSPGSANQQGYWNQFGTSGVISSAGAAYSTTASNAYGFLSFNALPFATGQDTWAQASSGTQSSIAFLDPNGLHLRKAASGSSNGGFSTFWGSIDSITLNASTGLMTTSTLAMARCASASGNCASDSSGDVTIGAGSTTVTVSTTAVTANSQIHVRENSTKGSELSVTCNTTTGRVYEVTAVTAGTSFQITSSAAPSTNPACISFTIVN